jgi:tetratricopeptide (TPR) repeat protein
MRQEDPSARESRSSLPDPDGEGQAVRERVASRETGLFRRSDHPPPTDGWSRGQSCAHGQRIVAVLNQSGSKSGRGSTVLGTTATCPAWGLGPMGDAKTPRGTGGRPAPEGSASLDELAERLQALRVWADVSYRELHRRLLRRRRSRGIPEEPAYATVYRCLQPGRTRLDIDLVAEIAAELTGDDSEAGRWRQAHAQLDSRARTSAYASIAGSLPDDIAEFTGRDSELALLLDQLDPDATNVMAIEGMAGVGKTTLAVRVARRILAHRNRTETVLAVNLCGHDPDQAPMDPMAVLDGFLRRLGEPGPRIQSLDLTQRAARFRDLLSAQPGIVLLDNAASASQIEPLLPAPAGSTVLVTSRHRVVSEGSDPTRHLTLDVFTPEQATELLRTRCDSAIDAGPELAAHIVEQVGRLPLAVALVAARIESSPEWALQDHLDQLVERRATLRLDRGVELAFATSYEALPPSLRRMLRRLALHPGRDVDTYAAAALAGIDIALATRQLASLVEGNLLNTRTAGRHELHDLLRIFALGRARDEDPPSARRAALTRLFDHYRWSAAMAMDVYAPEEQDRRPQVQASGTARPEVIDRADAITWLETERPNLTAVAMHAAEHGWTAHLGDLSAVLARYLLLGAHYAEAARLHRRASEVTSGSARAAALKNLAVILWHQGRPGEAQHALAGALDIARSTGDRSIEASSLTNLGSVLHHLGDYQGARDLFLKSLEIGQQIGDRTVVSRILMNLGILDQIIGSFESGLRNHLRALEMARTHRNRSTEMHALQNLSCLYDAMGRYTEALECAEASATIAEQVGDPSGLSEALTSIGRSRSRQGQFDAALEAHERALSIAQSIASITIELVARLELGVTLRMRGELRQAVEHHRRARAIATDIEEPYLQALASDSLGADYFAMRRRTAAESCWREALDLFSDLGVPDATRLRSKLTELDSSFSETPHSH